MRCRTCIPLSSIPSSFVPETEEAKEEGPGGCWDRSTTKEVCEWVLSVAEDQAKGREDLPPGAECSMDRGRQKSIKQILGADL